MRRSAAAAVAAILLALTGAAPAPAATSVDVIARALERSPLFVDPAIAAAVPERDRRSLVRALRRAPRPVFVALIPFIDGDEYGGDGRDFLSVLHDRVGRDGLYVTIEDRLLVDRSYGATGEEEQAANWASYVIIGERPRNEAPGPHVERFLAALQDPALAERYDRARGPTTTEDGASSDESGGSDSALVPIGVLLLAAAGAAGLFYVRRRRRGARYAPDPLPVLPRQVFEHARSAAAEDLREHARAAVVDFSAAIDVVDAPAGEPAAEQYQLALDAYGAASNTLDDARGVPDLAGVLALVDRGRAALAAATALAAGRPAPQRSPLCFFNPLHGHAGKTIGWQQLTVPACSACATDVRRGRPPDALRDGAEPYFEAGGVWARTGYGALDDDLVARILRGER